MSNLQFSATMGKVSNGLSLQQLRILKTELMQRRDALLRSLHDTEYHLQTFLEISDAEERSQQREEYRLDLTVQEKEKLQLQCIEQALQRIRTGCYGCCELSGEPIGMARLQAQPTATLSRNAQEALEEQEK